MVAVERERAPPEYTAAGRKKITKGEPLAQYLRIGAFRAADTREGLGVREEEEEERKEGYAPFT